MGWRWCRERLQGGAGTLCLRDRPSSSPQTPLLLPQGRWRGTRGAEGGQELEAEPQEINRRDKGCRRDPEVTFAARLLPAAAATRRTSPPHPSPSRRLSLTDLRLPLPSCFSHQEPGSSSSSRSERRVESEDRRLISQHRSIGFVPGQR